MNRKLKYGIGGGVAGGTSAALLTHIHNKSKNPNYLSYKKGRKRLLIAGLAGTTIGAGAGLGVEKLTRKSKATAKPTIDPEPPKSDKKQSSTTSNNNVREKQAKDFHNIVVGDKKDSGNIHNFRVHDYARSHKNYMAKRRRENRGKSKQEIENEGYTPRMWGAWHSKKVAPSSTYRGDVNSWLRSKDLLPHDKVFEKPTKPGKRKRVRIVQEYLGTAKPYYYSESIVNAVQHLNNK